VWEGRERGRLCLCLHTWHIRSRVSSFVIHPFARPLLLLLLRDIAHLDLSTMISIPGSIFHRQHAFTFLSGRRVPSGRNVPGITFSARMTRDSGHV